MRVVNDLGAVLAGTGLALGLFLVVAALVELKTGRPIKPLGVIRWKRRRQGSRAATLSMLCFGLECVLIGLTNVTGWQSAYPGVMLFVTSPIVLILLGLAIFFAAKGQQGHAPAGASPRTGPPTGGLRR